MEQLDRHRMLSTLAKCFIGALLSLPLAASATTYATMWSSIFSSNSQEPCTSCHHSSLVGAVARHAAPDTADFDVYAEAAARADLINSYISADLMPNDPAQADYTFKGALNGTEKAIVADWAADGAPYAAATATTGSATSISKTGATLNSTINTNVHSATTVPGAYYYQYGLTAAYGSTTSSTARSSTAATSATGVAISGLSCGTTYHFRVRASNGHGTTSGSDNTFPTSACSAPVINVNGSPDNGPLAINVSKGQSLTNADFLITATDVDTTSTLDWSITSSPAAGSASTTSMNTPNPAITYTAPAAVPVPATVSFTVQVADETPGTALTDSIVVNVTVVDNAPTIDEGSNYDFAVTEDTTNNVLQLNATDIDGDPLTWTTQVSPTGTYSGAVNGADDTKFDILYSPPPNADTVNADTFTVRVSDGTGFSEIVVSVDITGTPDDPVANDDAYEVLVNSGNTALDVLANDVNIDTGDTREVISVTTPTNSGTATVNGAGPGNNILFKPGNNVFVPSKFDYTIRDGDLRTDTATVVVSFPDTDGDGVIDYLDNCAATSNAGQGDVDGDGVPYQTDNSTTDPVATDGNGFIVGGDACDEDIDGDGMPNTFENTYGFDPTDPSDAALDYDGDGVSNLQEYIDGTDPTLDTVGPVLTAPADVTVSATGFLTSVNIGKATANDVRDGSIVAIAAGVDIAATDPTLLDDCTDIGDFSSTVDPFRPGAHIVTWATCDAAGNFSSVTQNVTVRPLVETTAEQTTGENRTVNFDVMLNGPAASYPVTVDYSVSGRADSGADHDATNGTISITDPDIDGNSPGVIGRLPIMINADALTEVEEDIILTLSNPKKAALGPSIVHTIYITEDNKAPLLDVMTTPAATVVAGDAVSVLATASDPNDDALSFDWSATDNTILALPPTITPGVNTSTLAFNAPAAGLYPVKVKVTDGKLKTVKSFLLNVLPAALDPDDCDLDGVADADTDCDDDGVINTTEGDTDTDGDGIADYLDNDTYPANILQNQTGDAANSYLLETDPGLVVRLGTTAVASGSTGAMVSQDAITNNGGKNGTKGLLPEDDYINISGFYDFEITGLNTSTDKAAIVIPLPTPILASAVYRKYDGSGWKDFVEDDNNSIKSAAGEPGVCPVPRSAKYKPGLTLFHYCVQLVIQDGGPNDADGLRDYVIRDPGGVAIPPESETVATSADGRIGVLHPLLLIALVSVLGLFYRLQLSRRTGDNK